MPGYWPHTEDEIQAMLADLGLGSLEELFAMVPPTLRLAGLAPLPPGRPEPDVLAGLRRLARRNRAVGEDLVCFAGAGAYDREIPPVTSALGSRPEFVTSYTPYQPEVSQGVLQLLFEFQTLLVRLTGMEVANASLYDGAASLVEAVHLAVGATGRHAVWVSQGVHPSWRQVLATMAAGPGYELVTVPLVEGRSRLDLPEGAPPPAAIVVAQPNHLGCVEDLGALRAACDETGALAVVTLDPVAAGVLRAPGELGADLVVGEGQPLGVPLSFGGPYLGLFAARARDARRLPGRLVGETVDQEGRRAYVTTLRTREQDIRRERATSNVCTNQTLLALVAAIQLAWLGPTGLAAVATRSAQGAHYCRDQLREVAGLRPLVEAPFLYEFAVHLPVPAELAIERLADEGFLGGVALDPELAPDGHGLLVAVTERRTREEIDRFAAALAKVVR
ncbi:aminomethyl-transferring glycine dehydrogenase subunit GcvPA [Aciditerrimonas ferrireducens]|jgi:glycine dehydrogenase subunit 1|uniref:Aminomethyl-transferring glycine dehydrogenase subunit GcvPA n=1 Tax=Aciditerrimonas ferrireducens TaxID=667306 RepID=A0ABV6BZP3_9ACTN